MLERGGKKSPSPPLEQVWPLSSLQPAARASHAAFVHDRKMYIWGGQGDRRADLTFTLTFTFAHTLTLTLTLTLTFALTLTLTPGAQGRAERLLGFQL